MKKAVVPFVIAMTMSVVAISAQAKTPALCEKEAVSAAKDFAADQGDEACAGEEKTDITDVSQSQNKEEYSINVDCGGGTSFSETVILDTSCKVTNPQ